MEYEAEREKRLMSRDTVDFVNMAKALQNRYAYDENSELVEEAASKLLNPPGVQLDEGEVDASPEFVESALDEN